MQSENNNNNNNKSQYNSNESNKMDATAPPPPYLEVVNNQTTGLSNDYYPSSTILYPSPTVPVVVIYQQPDAAAAATAVDNFNYQNGEPPNAYLIWSLFNTFCCCCLFGLIAVFFSFKTKLTINNTVEAQKFSRITYVFNVCSTVLGIFGLIFGAFYEIIDHYD